MKFKEAKTESFAAAPRQMQLITMDFAWKFDKKHYLQLTNRSLSIWSISFFTASQTYVEMCVLHAALIAECP